MTLGLVLRLPAFGSLGKFDAYVEKRMLDLPSDEDRQTMASMVASRRVAGDSDKSIRDHVQRAADFMTAVRLPTSALSRRIIRTYFARRTSTPLAATSCGHGVGLKVIAPTSVRPHQTSLQYFLEAAMGRRDAEALCPVEYNEPPTGRALASSRFYRPKHLQAILDALPCTEDKALFICGLHGLSASEACALNLSDVSFDSSNGMPLLSIQGDSPRIVPIIHGGHLVRRHLHDTQKSRGTRAHLFAMSRNQENRLDPNGFSTKMSLWQRRTPTVPHLTLKRLHDTMQMHLLVRGVNEQIIRSMFGLRITRRIETIAESRQQLTNRQADELGNPFFSTWKIGVNECQDCFAEVHDDDHFCHDCGAVLTNPGQPLNLSDLERMKRMLAHMHRTLDLTEHGRIDNALEELNQGEMAA